MITDVKPETIYEGFLKLTNWSFRWLLPDGDRVPMQAEVIHKKDVVAALLYNIEARTLTFVEQFRMPVYLTTQEVVPHLEVCAGYIDKDEKPEQAVKGGVMFLPAILQNIVTCFLPNMMKMVNICLNGVDVMKRMNIRESKNILLTKCERW